MRKRTAPPWMSAADYGRTLSGLSVNLIVRDVSRSVPFYTDVLALRLLHADADFAAFEGEGVRLQIHADHTYERMPWAPRLASGERRGLGTEIRILGIDPDAAERRAREAGYAVLVPVRGWPHGWRDCILEDPDGYAFAVGTPL
jgi:catechol 2,3-dioxygenase-like lactoylglutathione lyase family enzyme